MSKQSTRDKLTAVAIVAIMLLLVINAYLMYNKYNQDKIILEQKQELEEVTQLKNELDQEYYEAIAELDDLKSDNETLNVKIEEQKEKIEEQKQSIDRLMVDRRSLQKARQQLEELRNNIDDYLAEIEELHEKNKELSAENQSLTQKNQSLESEIEEEQSAKSELLAEKDTLLSRQEQLKKERQKLSQKVDRASAIEVKAIEAEGFKVSNSGKYRSRRRADNIEVLKICFETSANQVISAGEETFYIRIINPIGETIAIEELGSGTLESNNDRGMIRYTQKVTINYYREPTTECIEWDPNASFMSGLYEIEIYNKGYRTGKSTFELR